MSLNCAKRIKQILGIFVAISYAFRFLGVQVNLLLKILVNLSDAEVTRLTINADSPASVRLLCQAQLQDYPSLLYNCCSNLINFKMEIM